MDHQQSILTATAVVVSLCSLAVSALALGWNIYRDVILKPRLKVAFSVSEVIANHLPAPARFLALEATNHGPGQVKCEMIHLKHTTFWSRLLRRTKRAVLIHDFANPLSGQLPTRLDVGERVNLLLPYEEDCFLASHFTHIGLKDSFGNIHWASRADVAKAKRMFRADFGQV